MIEPGSWLVEGIGEDFIPKICELGFVKRAYTITDSESIAAARELLKREGIICGSSSGTLLAAALRYCREQSQPQRVVSFVCDSGNKYLSKIYNEYWLDDHGFILREATNDLRDLITHPHTRKSAVTVLPSDTLKAAYRKMRMYDVSQLPVMDDGQLLGLVSETDLLLAVHGNQEGFSKKVSDAMARNLVTLEASQSIEDLPAIFERGMVAIIMDKEEFLGLITPIDLLQYLRKRMGQS
jgi:cystathionine beta-synthase